MSFAPFFWPVLCWTRSTTEGACVNIQSCGAETIDGFGMWRFEEAMHEKTTPLRVLDRLLEPVGRCLSRRAARELADLRADEEVQAHVRELAEKCNEGMLSTEERAEYEAYVMAANVVAILQAKARARLSANS
jgi:hypothetical protein